MSPDKAHGTAGPGHHAGDPLGGPPADDIDHADRHEEQAHHAEHAGEHDHAAMFRSRFLVTLVLAAPVVVYSEHLQHWFGYTAPIFPGSGLLAPVLGTVIFLYGGWPFLSGGWWEARERQPGMMLLIAMAITVAYTASMATSLGLFGVEVWWELSLLIAIMLLGHWMEMRAVGQARGALAALAELLPDEAERLSDEGEPEKVRVVALRVDDIVLVRPGGRVPVDGEIVKGRAELDESMITGESNPVAREEGDRVVAGTVVADSTIRVKVAAVGEETALAGIQRLVEQAQQSGSRAQALADRAAAFLFYAAIAAAVLTVMTWLGLGRSDAAVTRSVTVLIIACPHALGLAIPLVVSISTSLSARNGILIKERIALEHMRSIDVVLFDKTGTLTKGEHALRDIAATAGEEESDVLAIAAAVEAESEHPLARAIVAAAEARGIRPPGVEDFRSFTGRGVEGQVGGATVSVGGPALLREREIDVPDDLQESASAWRRRGSAILYVVRGDEVVGAVALEDQVREESRAAVEALHREGLKVALITGDAQQVADTVAAELHIDEVFAEVLPEDKDRAVVELQERGHRVAMVGDGVNDAPALARADVGIAIGAGTDVAIESAGIVLAGDDPRAVVAARRLSGATYRKMLQNLWWAAGYNVVAIPLAAGVLAWAGFVLPMAVGALLMSVSTVVVAINAQFLRRVDLTPAAQSM